MRYINKSKPIRFSLLVGGKECLVVEDVKKNFNLRDLYDSLMNQNLAKWLSQIGKTDLLKKIESISKTDMLTQKIRLYNLFAPKKLSSDSPNIGTVKELLVKCCITFDDLKGTQYARNIELKKTAIENVDDEIINRWCESDLELLKYVYSKKSYKFLSERNCRTLIDKKIVTDKDLIHEIAIDKNLDDIFERYGDSTRNVSTQKDKNVSFTENKVSVNVGNKKFGDALVRSVMESQKSPKCLLVGGKECFSVESVKRNFDFNSLYDSLMNKKLADWLSQIGAGSLLKEINSIARFDVLTRKVRLYNLFAPQKLSSNSANTITVKELIVKGCINYDDVKGTPYGKDYYVLKAVVEIADNETINRCCELNLEILKDVYSKKSYKILNARNCRTLIDKKIVTDEDLILEIAIEKNLVDIFERYEKSTQKEKNVSFTENKASVNVGNKKFGDTLGRSVMEWQKSPKCLLVGGKECFSVEDVRRNFDFNSLYDSLMNKKLADWLSQIGERNLLKEINSIVRFDVLARKVRLYNLFAPQKLLSNSVNTITVKELIVKGCINFYDIKGTPYGKDYYILKAMVEIADNETINRCCELNSEILKDVYSKKSYKILNARNCRTLIARNIVSDKKMILEIATKNNFTDILACYRKNDLKKR